MQLRTTILHCRTDREFRVVRQEVDGGVAVLTLANPPVNALGAALRAALDGALATAIADDSVRAIVLAAEGRVFVGGADITEFGKPQHPPSLPDVLDRLDASPKPVVAAIGGVGARRRPGTGDGLPRPGRGAVRQARPAGDQARDHPGGRGHAAPAAPDRARRRLPDDAHRRAGHRRAGGRPRDRRRRGAGRPRGGGPDPRAGTGRFGRAAAGARPVGQADAGGAASGSRRRPPRR